MSEVSVQLNPDSPKPKKEKKKAPPKTKEEIAKANRRAMISSVIIGSIVVHVIALVLFGLWTVAQHFSRPEARFEMKKSVKIPPKTPEHKMNVAKHEAMAPKPTFNDKLVSTRPIDFALPEMPEVDLDQMLPLDPSEMISDQVNGLVGSAGLGSGLGSGMSGGGGTGEGMSLFGIRAEGDRILLVFDVSVTVKNKAAEAGIPMERIQEETIKMISTLPITAQFSIIQFTGNYMPFSDELVAATPAKKKEAQQWVKDKWVTAGSMSSASAGVVRNLRGAVGVLEKAAQMRPDVIFLISDASLQWRPDGDNTVDIPYEELEEALKQIQENAQEEVPIQFIAFEPDEEDEDFWKRILRRTGGNFQEMKEK